MNRVIHYLFLLIVVVSSLSSVAENNTNDVIVFQQLTSVYLSAYNKSDFSFLSKDAINQQEYDAIVSRVSKQNPDCLTEFDKTFDVNIFKRSFEKSHLARLHSDTIVVDRVTAFTTCSDLDIRKLSCFVYFKKSNTSVPITLIVIKTSENKYKILLDIINENYFSNEKN